MAKTITAAVPGPDWKAIDPDAPILGQGAGTHFDLNGRTAEAMGWQRVRLHHPSRANPREVFWDEGIHVTEYPDFTRGDGDSILKSFLRRRGLYYSLHFSGTQVQAHAPAIPNQDAKGETEGEALARLILHLKKAGKIEKHAWNEEHVCQRCDAKASERRLDERCPNPDMRGLS